ncbi:hypothetical protein BDV33DRAFT_186137 [Aspergillus novoparasiticus]|uniref:Uncharacterized protein n=1 Tax=Aspergillus novoparasiticus TaxID=986946 RepID=A0A5N6E5F5_9EURO|nr:hypothetical protein BDV33DRAFT_186137 [Aspergillus novoparasiticus]
MKRLRNATTSIFNSGQTVAREHTTALVVSGTGLALATAPITGPAILGAVGFSAAGPVAASFAAAWQASIGAVQAGSLFATLQGAAMGGAAAGTFTTASNIGIGMVGSAAVGTQWTDIKKRLWMKHDSEHSEEAGYHDESQPAEDNEGVANNPHMPDIDDLLGTEFSKFLKIDMS